MRRSLVLVLLLLGLFFRVAYLDSKVYWVDEVATSIRISGYTRPEITAAISTGQPWYPPDLRAFQTLNPQRGWSASFQALMQSPEHAPLYFLLVRAWAIAFGTSAAALRSLSVILGLAALPLFYSLSRELFNPVAARIVVGLAAVSPLFVAYAQEARPYSLWLVMMLASSGLLLRSLRYGRNGWLDWCFYGIAVALGLYTSLLTVWVTVAQGIFVGLSHRQQLTRWAIAATAALVAFTPWLWVIATQWQRLQDNTTWMRVPMQGLAMLAIWLYSVVIAFVDFPVYLPVDGVIMGAIAADLGLLALVALAFYRLGKTASEKSVNHWLVLTLALTTPLGLLLVDLLTQGQSSTAPRYLLPMQLAVQLAIASLFSQKLTQWRWRGLLAIVLSLGILSCSVNLQTSPKYQKIRSLHNPAIAALINQQVNQQQSPLVLAESKDVMDLLSLSRSLVDTVEIRVLSPQSSYKLPQTCKNVLLFNPSEKLRSQVPARLIYQPQLLIPDEISLNLWAIESQPHCGKPY